MKKPIGAACVAALLVALPSACDFEKTQNQLQANKVIVATLLATPPVDLDPTSLVDAGTAWPDGGFEPDAGTLTVPGQTAAQLFFGERERQSVDQAPRPLNGAQAFVAAGTSAAVALESKGEGLHQGNSSQLPDLAYRPGEDYIFRVEHQGEVFLGKVESAPALERIEALHPPQGFIDHLAGRSFTFSRPAPPAGQERNLGFLTVFPVDSGGEKGEPTYTNVPSKPLELLELVARPGKFREETVVVPGSAFPDPERTYLLIVQAVKIGKPESDNLFSGSALLVGTAEVGIFRTRSN